MAATTGDGLALRANGELTALGIRAVVAVYDQLEKRAADVAGLVAQRRGEQRANPEVRIIGDVVVYYQNAEVSGRMAAVARSFPTEWLALTNLRIVAEIDIERAAREAKVKQLHNLADDLGYEVTRRS
jgi:hypothetical protein